MTKNFRWIIPIVIGIAVILLICAFFFARNALKTPVGIIDGVYYDMSPDRLKDVLGEPQSMTDYMELVEETVYNYTVDIDGVPTQIGFSFLDDKNLIAVRAYVEADDAAGAGEIFENWMSKLYTAYQDKKGFYCDEIHKNSDTDYEIDLGTHLGATGIFCTISVEENIVRLNCTNMK